MPGMSLLASGLDYIGNVLETISDKRVREDPVSAKTAWPPSVSPQNLNAVQTTREIRTASGTVALVKEEQGTMNNMLRDGHWRPGMPGFSSWR